MPKSAEGAIFRESILMGTTTKTEHELFEMIAQLRAKRYSRVRCGSLLAIILFSFCFIIQSYR